MRLANLSRDALRDGRVLGEALAVIVITWLLIGWWFDEPLLRGDGPRLFAPYLRSALDAGPDWTANTYRFSAFGGSAMHAAIGTSPLTLVWSALGVSTTTAANLNALFVQLSLGFFAIVLIEAWLTVKSGSQHRLSAIERALTACCCAFAPAIGWRFAAGHENLLQGMLPWFATIALWWSARRRTLSITTLLVGWLAVFHGLPALGQQTLVYSVVFGAPITLVTVFGAPPGSRFVSGHVAVVLVLVAGVLSAVPLVLDIVSYQLGDDASRGARSMYYAYGHPYARDWLTSVPWTTAGAIEWPGKIATHETNYPIGPLVVVAVALWPRGFARDLGLATVAAALLAIAFSLDLEPVSSLLRQIPLIDAFRVPARAMLPVVVFVPLLALAGLWSRTTLSRVTPRQHAAAAALAAVAVVVAPLLPSLVREVLAWASCGAVCIALRRIARPPVFTIATFVVIISALSIAAFADRYESVPAAQRIEDEPQALRHHVLALAPDLASPLNRVQVPDRSEPFGKSVAIAAGLSSLDGVGFPPRRFLRLLSALWNKPVSPAEADFALTHRDRFDILAQLYNVHYVVEASGALKQLGPTNGAAWFTQQLAFMDDPREMIRVLRMRRADVRAMLATVAWVQRDEAPLGLRGEPSCAAARVENIATDRLGQAATIEVVTPATCVLVVATNYASMLVASSGGQALEVFPVDISLTGVIVPRGATHIELRPYARRRWRWGLLGLVALAGGLGVLLSRQNSSDPSSSS